MYIYKCRLCDSKLISKVIDLGFHPLADTFLTEDMLKKGAENWHPLSLGLCDSCGHVFTLYSISPEDRYQKNEYSYDSSNSQVSINHFEEFAKTVLKEIPLPLDSLIIDIGSNVGTLLSQFKKLGYSNILGIEPSKNIANIAIELGIPTINDFFNIRSAKESNKIGLVDVLLSSNVVNHIDNIVELLNVAKCLLKENGVFVFEVPYLLDLIQSHAFDTIYHEHVHYYGVKPLSKLLNIQGFSIFKIERLDYMCGSIRVYARTGGVNSNSISNFIDKEVNFGLYNKSTFEIFMKRIRKLKLTVNSHLSEICLFGGKVVAIGAATKGNTFLNYCRLDSDVISYITDTSSLKIGKITPGSHIVIKSDNDIGDDITHALILPWNISSYLQSKLSHLKLKFYVPQIEV